MLLSSNTNKKQYPLQVSFLFLFIGWTVIIAGILAWTYYSSYQETITLARREAYKGYEKDVTFRAWAAMHGGVYVPITETTPPNPYLKDIPERDIETPSGKKLTLMNPAYITRQVHELSLKDGIIGHITSLNPIRDLNAPDEWEKKALTEFESGALEYYGFDTLNSKKYFRYMAPLTTKDACLKCHAAQGYKAGDVRGGISSSIPWDSYQASINSSFLNNLFGYGIIWVIGLVGIAGVKKKFVIYITRRDVAEEEMQKLNKDLLEAKNAIEQNLSERTRMVEELTVTKNQLESTNQEKDKFFSIIAHDLRSPFQGFLGISDILANDYRELSPEEIAKMSSQLNVSASNLYKLLDNLLEWSRIKNGSIRCTPATLSLSTLIQQNIDLLKTRAGQKELTFHIETADDIAVYADEKMVNSVLRNLLSNAVKFTRPSGSITVSASCKDGFAQVAVRDTGIGMAQQDVSRLFKITEKVGRPGTDGEPSTGLGLLLCKEFIELNGGAIWAESSENSGSTFYFTLPVSTETISLDFLQE